MREPETVVFVKKLLGNDISALNFERKIVIMDVKKNDICYTRLAQVSGNQMNLKRNGLIELYRFVFSLCIVSHHALFLNEPGHIPVIGGYIAVEFFFILTGFLLTKSILSPLLPKEEDSAIYQIIKKCKPFYLYFSVTWILSFVLSHVVNHDFQVQTIIWDFIRAIPQLLLLSMAGLGGSSDGLWDYNGTGWYISVLILAILILYPMIKHFKTQFSSSFAPVIAILIYGYIIQNYNFLGVVNQWSGFCYLGLFRGIAGMSLGSFCYYIVQIVAKKKVDKSHKLMWSFLQLSLLFLILCLMEKYITGFIDVVQVILFSILIVITFANESFLSELCDSKWCRSLGKFSMIIFTSQCLVYNYSNLWWYPEKWCWRYGIYIVYVLIVSLFNYLIVENIQRRHAFTKIRKHFEEIAK